MSEGVFSRIDEAVAAIGRGEIVIVVDDPGRENEGDFVMAAEQVTPEAVNFMITHGRGLLCLPMAPEHVDRLHLRSMARGPHGPGDTAFTMSIDLVDAHTGISAQERAATIRRAVDGGSRAQEFRSPGHVFPLRAAAGGVLERPGHTEASVDLARLAGLEGAGAICEIIRDDGRMARLPDLVEMAQRLGMHLVTIADLVAHRRRHEALVRRVSESTLPTPYGTFRAICYASDVDGLEHLALVRGDARDGTLVRVHHECVLGDALAGLACRCGAHLREAFGRIASEGAGVVVYVRGTEADMARCRALDDDAGAGGQILRDLGIRRVRLATLDPAESARLASCGIIVEREASSASLGVAAR